jgi:MoxR-like ATPase
MLSSVDEASARLAGTGYLPSREIATAVFLADRLEKPLLVEGPAGVGKTDLSRAFAEATGRTLVRLQCYEGLDESKALYEWEYAKQLLYTQLLRDRIGESIGGARSLAEAADRIASEGNVFFSERFLLPRPILRAVTSQEPVLLLVDEVDRADPEFEAFLLEVLADYAVTVPELGTFRASRTPRAVLTSNASRDLSDAIKRRCLHLHIGFPTQERELAIVRAKVPQAGPALAEQAVAAVARLRSLDLKKPPSISETLDWVKALVLLQAQALEPQLVSDTLNLLLKYEADVEKARREVRALSSGTPFAAS